MSRQLAWLSATSLCVTAATLGIVGLIAHLDDGRSGSVIAFDVLWIVAFLVAASAFWRRTKWSRRS